MNSENGKLKPLSPLAERAFVDAEHEILERTLNGAFKTLPETVDNPENMKEKYREGFDMIMKILHSIMTVGETALLQDQIEWGKDRLPHEGISPELVLQNFQLFRDATEQVLAPETAEEVLPYFDYLIKKQKKVIGDKT